MEAMKVFPFRDYEIRYAEAGAGEPLVFLHNGGNDHRIWDHQMARFANTHRVFALDHLGFGQSDKPPIELPLSLYSEAVEAFIEHLSLSPVALIGNCMGSAMAFDYSLRRPEQVKRLILCNITSQRILRAGPLKSVYEHFAENRPAREAFIAGLEANGQTREDTDAILRSQLGSTPPKDEDFADYLFDLYNQPGQMRSLYVVLSNFDDYRSPDEFSLPPNFPPTCVIWGKENFILPASAGKEFCERLQPDRVEFVDGCGHLLMRERPAEVNQIIEQFLRAEPVSQGAGS
ncbi:MAG: alpha/beta hydrolase [Acidobacteriota bacterium]